VSRFSSAPCARPRLRPAPHLLPPAACAGAARAPAPNRAAPAARLNANANPRPRRPHRYLPASHLLAAAAGVEQPKDVVPKAKAKGPADAQKAAAEPPTKAKAKAVRSKSLTLTQAMVRRARPPAGGRTRFVVCFGVCSPKPRCLPPLNLPPHTPSLELAVGVRVRGELADLLPVAVLLPQRPDQPPDRRLLHPLVDQVSAHLPRRFGVALVLLSCICLIARGSPP
jgi:hypothetical protein